jgi:hypothetical protein
MGDQRRHSDAPAAKPAEPHAPDIVAHADVTSFFAEAIQSARDETGVALSLDAEYYLVALLAQFAQNPSLLDDLLGDQPLSLAYYEAAGAEPGERLQRFRRIGDGSLYVTGYFADSFTHSLVDIEHYIDLGGRAYGTLSGLFARRSGGTVFASLYQELAHKFTGLVELLNVVSDHSVSAQSTGDATSIVRLYERWRYTHSERLARILANQGVHTLRRNPVQGN